MDRRRRPTPPISRYLFWGRRKTPAPGQTVNSYVDRPAPQAWRSGLLLVCLSMLDALLSLRLFSTADYQELNPLLLIGLGYGVHVFLAIKITLTVASVLVLLIHWRFVIGEGAVRVAWLIRTLILAYLCIVVYELLLLSH